MSKEYWLNCFEYCVEDIANERGLEFEEAEKVLEELLDKNPNYLDGYITYD